MHQLERIIEREFQKAKERRWDCIYIVVDLHETVFKSTYKLTQPEFFPHAKETLQYLSTRKDIVLICWSSLSPKQFNEQYLPVFLQSRIIFQFLNENPLEKNTDYADFSKKFYFNILLDDKAGFNPYEDWQIVHEAILSKPQLNAQSLVGYRITAVVGSTPPLPTVKHKNEHGATAQS